MIDGNKEYVRQLCRQRKSSLRKLSGQRPGSSRAKLDFLR